MDHDDVSQVLSDAIVVKKNRLALPEGTSTSQSQPSTSLLLSPVMTFVLTMLTRMFEILSDMVHRTCGIRIFTTTTQGSSISSCWRCQWLKLPFEGIIHLIGFFIKLWLSLTLLLRLPTSYAMYGHVLTQIGISLLLVCTTVLMTHMPHIGEMFLLPTTLAVRHRIFHSIRSIQLWMVETPTRWHIGRMILTTILLLNTTFWIVYDRHHHGHHMLMLSHGLNGLVWLIEMIGIVATFFATHTSHTSIHHIQQTNLSSNRTRMTMTHDDTIDMDDALIRRRHRRRPSSSSASSVSSASSSSTLGTTTLRIPLRSPSSVPTSPHRDSSLSSNRRYPAPVARLPLLLPPDRERTTTQTTQPETSEGSNNAQTATTTTTTARITRRRTNHPTAAAGEQPIRLIEEARRLR